MKNLSFILPLFLLFSINNSYGQTVMEWEKSFAIDEGGELFAVHPTDDGNYMAAGYKFGDYWIMKFDEQGNQLWENSFGELAYIGDYAFDMELTPDGGAVLAGWADTEAPGIDGMGLSDYWIVKVDGDGDLVWDTVLGGSDVDRAYALSVGDDGSVFVGGHSASNDGNVGSNIDLKDLWLVKLNSSGNLLWSTVFGDLGYEEAQDIYALDDGGCMVVGHWSWNNDDVLVLRYDANGNLMWQESYGGLESDRAFAIDKDPTGGFIIAGYAASNNMDVGENNGGWDYWVIKIEEDGSLIWEQNYGGSDFERAKDVYVKDNGEIMVLGYSYSDDLDVGANYGTRDFWFIKLSNTGELIWEENYGGTENDLGSAICLSHDGKGYLLAGVSNSIDGDITEGLIVQSRGWILKIREVGNTLTTNAFFDENNNGVWDANEQALNGQSFSIDPENVVVWTNQGGQAAFAVEPGGSYIVSADLNDPLWELNEQYWEIPIDVPDVTPNDVPVDFPFTPIADFSILKVDLTSSITRCNAFTRYWLTYSNIGTVVNDGLVSFEMDSTAIYLTAEPEPDSIYNGTLYWNFNELYPTYSEQIAIDFMMPGVDSLGSEIEMEANVSSNFDSGDDKSTLTSELVCAYDPNDKLAFPKGFGNEHYTLFEDSMEYTIRFQNTGNDTAFTVVIEDYISEHLDLSTFIPIASSHSVETHITTDSRMATFTFNDIYLPDSNVNEVASHGFIKFRISPKENLDNFSLVENTASIFFDLNPPIVTNTVFNNFVENIPAHLSAKIYLEGCYQDNDFMSTNLTEWLPMTQVYNVPPFNYEGTESLDFIPSNMVDWVLIEARSGTPNIGGEAGTNIIEQQAGILLNDGSIVNTSGTSGLRFLNLSPDESYYFAVRHRNHLSVLTATPLATKLDMNYDFTTGINQAFGIQQQKLSSDGKAMLFSGDANNDGTIQITDYDIWFGNNAVLNTYSPTDWNLDGIIQTTDFDLWFLNKAKLGIVEFHD